PTVCGQGKNRPSETPWRRKSWRNSLQVVDGALHKCVLFAIKPRQERDGRVVRVRCKGGPIDNADTGIPSSTGACAIHEHLDASIDAERQALQTTARARDLVEGKNRECGRNNPADRVRGPWPAILVGVETNVAIGSTKLPFPEPIRFLAGTVQQPVEALQPCGYCQRKIAQSHYHER